MSLRFGLIAMVILGVATIGWCADTLIVKPEVYVRGPKVLVGDVADLEGDNAQEMRAVEVVNAALPGNTKHIDAALILSRLRNAGYDPASVEVKGSRSVRATTLCLEITDEMLAEDLRRHIRKEIPWSDATVDVWTPSFDVVVPEGEVAIVWRSNPDYRYIGAGVFRGEVLVDGALKKTVLCRAHIEAYDDVVIAADNIPRGAMISRADLRTEKRPLSTLKTGAFRNPDEVLGMVSRSTLFEGQVITKQQIMPRRLVSRNQIVPVEAHVGALVVRGQARALTNAAEGDTVTCAHLETKQEFQGIVRKDGVVVVR